MFALVELRNFKGYKIKSKNKSICFLLDAKISKHVYFIRFMYFLKLWTIKMLKRDKMFNIFFCWEKMLSNFQLSGAPALGVGTNEQQSARVSEGYSVIRVSTPVLCCFTEKQVGPEEEGMTQGRDSLEWSGYSWGSWVPCSRQSICLPILLVPSDNFF